ncbi:MAG: serine--tRNA ligase [Candidatus Micrarchaeota archaeon]
MLDIHLIREKTELVRQAMQKRQSEVSVDELMEFDQKWRESKSMEDQLRNKRNKITIEIKEAKKAGKSIEELLKQARELPREIAKTEVETGSFLERRDFLLQRLPNIPHESVPSGGEENFQIVKESGKKPAFDFVPKQHHELANALEMLDMTRAAKIAGAGFFVFRKDLARLERALINFFLDCHRKNGLEEVSVPFLVNEKTAFGTGNLPKFEKDLYKTTDGFYLIPTAEVPVTNLFANETLEEKDLPKKFCSFTACFRTEAGKHGAETPGIFRLHQFDKVEMVFICTPEESWKLHEEMRGYGEQLLEKLGLHYRTKLLASGDMGIASAKTYDLEVYAPAMDKYLECSSISNCTDFQGRRMNTKFKRQNETIFCHTLNGSGLATSRLMIALLETYQTESGNIKIPKVLQPYMDGQTEIGKHVSIATPKAKAKKPAKKTVKKTVKSKAKK